MNRVSDSRSKSIGAMLIAFGIIIFISAVILNLLVYLNTYSNIDSCFSADDLKCINQTNQSVFLSRLSLFVGGAGIILSAIGTFLHYRK